MLPKILLLLSIIESRDDKVTSLSPTRPTHPPPKALFFPERESKRRVEVVDHSQIR